jgi:hypothetical protein
MFTPRTTMFIGLAVGAVWAITDFAGALLMVALGAIGLLIGMVLSQGLDLSELTSRRDEDRNDL